MSLGRLYFPTGKAKETAQQVLDVENPMAVNVAYGCRNACSYCYIPYTKPGQMRVAKEPWRLVEEQLKMMDDEWKKPEGVFLSFHTDPFLKENWEATTRILELLNKRDIKTATLSKTATSSYKCVRHGMTLVSLDNEFSMKYEKNAIMPQGRIELLRLANRADEYTWVSMEPYPTPGKHEQKMSLFLDALRFVDFAIFGAWNYDKGTKTPAAKEFYNNAVVEFQDFCKSHGIRHWVKTDTLKFIKGDAKPNEPRYANIGKDMEVRKKGCS
jgi:DNA repair photolyase